jgi:YD repeat-containing protein
MTSAEDWWPRAIRTARVTLAYDAASRLIREEQNGAVLTYDYDLEGQRLARRLVPDQGGKVQTVEAGARFGTEQGFQPTDEAEGRSSLVEYEYDADGWLTGIRAAGEEISYKRDRAGRLIERELPNGLVETYRYDPSGRLAGQVVVPRLAGAEIVRRSYQWDAIANLTEVNDTRRGSRRYHYDAVERLNRVERVAVGHGAADGGLQRRSGFQGSELPPERRLWLGSDADLSGGHDGSQPEVEEFQYDGDGNLLERKRTRGPTRSFVYGRGDRLERADSTQLIYDDSGNLVEKRRPDGSSISYEYDVDNQLSAVTLSQGERIEFSYDALGRRRCKRTREGEVAFLWDGDVLLGEQHTDKNREQIKDRFEYLHTPGSFLPSARVRWKPDGSLESHAYHVDYLGTPRELTDSAGRVVWEADYDEYGTTEIRKAEVPQSIRFQGQYEDSETGLNYNYYRYYDPESGRYITRIPSD